MILPESYPRLPPPDEEEQRIDAELTVAFGLGLSYEPGMEKEDDEREEVDDEPVKIDRQGYYRGNRNAGGHERVVYRASLVDTGKYGRAACLGANTDLFFGGQGSNNWVKAKAICSECPQEVRKACDEFAKATEADGIWAGVAKKHRGK